MSRILVIAKVVWLEMIRRKDAYVLLILLGVLLYALLTANIFGLGSTVRYVLDLGLLMSWLFSIILTVGVSSRQLPDEEKRGTIYPLLAKPVTRGELIVGKWLGAWSVAVAASAIFCLVVAGVVRLRGGSFGWLTLGQAWILFVAGLAALSALCVALSTRFTSGAAASYGYVIMGASLLVLPRVPQFIVSAGGVRAGALLALYYLLPHFELFDMRLRVVHEWGNIPASTCALLLCYGASLSAVFLLLGWLGYRRKRFHRGAIL